MLDTHDCVPGSKKIDFGDEMDAMATGELTEMKAMLLKKIEEVEWESETMSKTGEAKKFHRPISLQSLQERTVCESSERDKRCKIYAFSLQ